MIRAGAIVFACYALAACDRVFNLAEVPPGTPPDAAVYPPDLIAYLPMDGIAGGHVPELARGHDGVCAAAACPVATAGAIGGGLLFDGNQEVVHVAAADTLATAAPFTAAMWMRLDRALPDSTTACVLGQLLGTANDNSWQLCPTGPLLYVYTSSQPGTYTATVGPLPSVGEWHHVAIEWDGATQSLWVDASLLTADPATIAFDGGDIVIGADIDDGTTVDGFPGAVDDVRIYARVLAQSELLALAVR